MYTNMFMRGGLTAGDAKAKACEQYQKICGAEPSEAHKTILYTGRTSSSIEMIIVMIKYRNGAVIQELAGAGDRRSRGSLPRRIAMAATTIVSLL